MTHSQLNLREILDEWLVKLIQFLVGRGRFSEFLFH